MYVDPNAEELLSDAEADELRDRIEQGDAGAVYVAVLPEDVLDEAGGSTAAVAKELAGTLERTGVYAVLAGRDFFAGASPGAPTHRALSRRSQMRW